MNSTVGTHQPDDDRRVDKDNGNEEDGDAYDADTTSSYDSGHAAWHSNMTPEILHGKTPTCLPIVVQDLQKDGEKKWQAWNRDTPSKDVEEESPSLAVLQERRHREEEGILEMFLATKHFYAKGPAAESPPSVIVPLLEKGLTKAVLAPAQNLKRKNAPREGDEEKSPRPLLKSTRDHQVVLNDVECNDAPFPLSSTSTITFREALVATDKPRIICLSFAPFLIVHTNLAYLALAGFTSHEVLGFPLNKCFGEAFHQGIPSSVASLQDCLVPIASKRSRATRCFLNISLVGPEPLSSTFEVDFAEKESNGNAAFCVTHYAIDFEAIFSGEATRAAIGGNLRTAMVSPDTSTFCGVLG